MFGIDGVVGAMRIRSTRPLVVSSRIYNLNDGQTAGTSQGLFSSGIPADFGIRAGQSGVLQGIRVSDDFRYNIFLVETAGQPLSVALEIVDEAGVARGNTTISLQACGHHTLTASSIVMARSATAPSHRCDRGHRYDRLHGRNWRDRSDRPCWRSGRYGPRRPRR